MDIILTWLSEKVFKKIRNNNKDSKYKKMILQLINIILIILCIMYFVVMMYDKFFN